MLFPVRVDVIQSYPKIQNLGIKAMDFYRVRTQEEAFNKLGENIWTVWLEWKQLSGKVTRQKYS